jgi:hypothetical protein
VPTASPAGSAPAATAVATAVPESTDGALQLRVLDHNGLARPGIPIDATGTKSLKLVSGDGGIVRTTVPAGRYSLKVVAGCTEDLDVQSGGTGQADVAVGQTTTGELRATWRHRYAPGPPTTYEATDGKPTDTGTIPHWRPDVPYEVTFGVHDRCKSDALAPGAVYPSYRFVTSANTTVLADGGKKADGAGRGRLRASCSGRGVINLTSADSENPSEDAFDLLVEANGQLGRPGCAPD